MSEAWITTDDYGYSRKVIVDYDQFGNALVSREVLHDILIRAGMRFTMDLES